MYVLGIVGGVASGKSAVAQAFARRGAAALDADRVGHEVLLEPGVIAAFRQRWGEEVVDDNGQVVRRQVARRVFGGDAAATAERQFLDSVTHPRIRARLRGELDEWRATGTRVAVLDAALLYETSWNELCDGVLFVDAPQEVRRQRAITRGWSSEQFADREASQWPVARKRTLATWILANQGSTDEIEPQVDTIWRKIAQGESPQA
jgi:dephospho-CoA kinase